MKIINTKSLKEISSAQLSDFIGQIVLRTFYSLKPTADDFPRGNRTDDDYDFIQQYVKVTHVKDGKYTCLTIEHILDEQRHLLSNEPQSINRFNFYVPKASGRKSFFSAIKKAKKIKAKEYIQYMNYLDNILKEE